MLPFIIRRILLTIPLLLVTTLIIFLLIQAMPGNVVDTLCGLSCPPQVKEALIEKYGLDQPILIQYANWVGGIVCCLDFGYSPLTSAPAWFALVSEGRWFYTMLLIMSALIISWMIGMAVGVYSATHKYSLGDKAATLFSYVGLSIPNFIAGMLFIFIVVVLIQPGDWFQFGGPFNSEYANQPMSWMKFLSMVWHFGPPILILAMANTAIIARYMRANLLDVMSQAFVQTARAKGLREKLVIYKHAFRNALNPMVSMLGFWIPMMMEGALIIAIVFNIPQLENTFVQSLNGRDYTVVMAGLFMFSFILVMGNLISDIILALSDPKIRYD